MKLLTAFLILFSTFGYSQLFQASTPITVAPALGNYHPQVEMTNDGQPAVIWSNSADNHVYFAKYNGTSFDAPITLNPPLIDMQVYNFAGPDLAIDGDNIYVVMRSLGYETGHIYVVKSEDNGVTFGDTVRVDDLGTGFGQYPDIVAMNDTVWVTFMDHDAGSLNPEYKVVRSTDGGATWEPEVAAGSLFGAEACDCCPPEIIVDDEKLIVFFRNNNSNLRDIKAVVSYDRGASFTGMYSVDDHNWVIAGCPSTGPDSRYMGSDKTLTTYKSEELSQGKIFINEFNLGTMTSDGLVELSSPTGTNTANNYPQMDYKNGVTAVVWQGNENSVDTYFNAWVGGVGNMQVSDAINVSDVTGAQTKPDIIIGNGKYYVVYADTDGSNVKMVEVSVTAGITEELAQLETTVYPQPATDELTISFLNSGHELFELDVFDMTGRRVYSATTSNSIFEVSKDQVGPGTFVYILSSESKSAEGQLIFH